MDPGKVRHGLLAALQVFRWIERHLNGFRRHSPQFFERKAEFLKSFHDERDGTGTNAVPLLGSGVSDILLPEFYYADDS